MVNVPALVTSFADNCSSTVSASMVAVLSTLFRLAVSDALTIMPMIARSPTERMTIAIRISTRLKPLEQFLDRSIVVTSLRLFIFDPVVDVDLDLSCLVDRHRSGTQTVGVVSRKIRS